jgi:Type II secretion system (T2SS), protein E, N-terminal domain
MSNEAASSLIMEPTAPAYAFETIETVDTIAARIQHITATQVDQLALVTITLFFGSDGKTSSNQQNYGDQFTHTTSSAYFLGSLRPLVRKTDEVFQLDTTLYFLLRGATLQGGQIVQSRLWEALLWRIHNTTDREIIRPLEIAIGHSAYPAPHLDIGECIAAASEVSLQSNFTSERTVRKAIARQTRNTQQAAADEEWPALARKLGIPYLSLLPKKRPERVQQVVNASLAQELHCYPVGRERNMLTVAMLNPRDRVVLDRLQQETGLVIFPVLTHPEELQTALAQLI